MMVTQQAAVHLGNDNLDNLHSTKNQSQLVSEQTEIQGISLIENSLKRTTLLTDRAVQLSTAKVHVFSDSILRMERISETPVSAWNEKIAWFMNSFQCRELDRIEPMEFEWKHFQGFTTLQILTEIQNMMIETACEPEQFPGRIVFMSMYNHIVW